MTEDLRTVLHRRAEDARLPLPDPEAVTAAGRARVRRRRAGTVVAAVLASALLVGGGLALLPRSSNDTSVAGRPHATPSFSTGCGLCHAALSWAEGSTVHQGDQTIDVGHSITRYVQTRLGYVVVDTIGRVWSVVDGRVTQVGSGAASLVSDPDGTLAGWIDGAGRNLSFEVLDQATGAVQTTASTSRSVSLEGAFIYGAMIAVDGDTAYWRDGDQTVQRTLAGTTGTTGSFPLPVGWQLMTVRDGVAVEVDQRSDGRVTVGRVGDPTPVTLDSPPRGSLAALSPGATYVSFGSIEGAGSAEVYSATTGRRVDLDLGPSFTSVPFGWVDGTHVAVLTARAETSDFQILTCSVVTSRCTVQVPDLGESPRKPDGRNGVSFVLPTGTDYYPFLHG